MKRWVGRLFLLLLARMARRRLIRTVRRWIIRWLRRQAGANAGTLARRTAGKSIITLATLLGRTPLRHSSGGERLIMRLFVLAEEIGGSSNR